MEFIALPFFNTPARRRFLMFVIAIAAPILLATAWVTGWMESDAAARGAPNAYGGQHYRIEDKNGAKTLPAPLAAMLSPPPGMALTDVNLDTDSSGRIRDATAKGFTSAPFADVAAFHKPGLNPITEQSDTQLWGLREGYEVKIIRGDADDSDPYQDRTKVEYYITPVKP
ncbi:hypothetical protein [Sphingomonas sp. UYAg733]